MATAEEEKAWAWMVELVASMPRHAPYWEEERMVLAAMTAYGEGWRVAGARHFDGTEIIYRDMRETRMRVPNEFASKINMLSWSERNRGR